MTLEKKAIVIGGSLGGLFAGNLLLRAGWDVHIYERAEEELESRGAGIVTHPELIDALLDAGVVVDHTLGVRVEERITLGQDGSRLDSRFLPQTLTAWSRIYQAVRSIFPNERYHSGKQLVSVAQTTDCATAIFADGRTMTGDILVAADGVRSAVRQLLLPAVKSSYAGYIAWRGLIDEAHLSDRVMQDLFPYFAFCLPPHEQMLAYPVAGKNNSVESGKRRYNFVWYRPADQASALRDMLTDDIGKVWEDGIPPPRIRQEVLAQARRAARQVLAPQFAEIVERTENLFFQPISDLESSSIAFDRIALLGDAAFVARPHCGMGVTKAAGDAVALIAALGQTDDVIAALKAYELPRVKFGRLVVERGRQLGAYMQAQITTSQERDMAERFRTPAAVMESTAVPLLSPVF